MRNGVVNSLGSENGSERGDLITKPGLISLAWILKGNGYHFKD